MGLHGVRRMRPGRAMGLNTEAADGFALVNFQPRGGSRGKCRPCP